MLEPEEVTAMLRLNELGWGAKKIARELGVSRNTEKDYIAAGGWTPYQQPERKKALDGLEEWLRERLRRDRGNADVIRFWPDFIERRASAPSHCAHDAARGTRHGGDLDPFAAAGNHRKDSASRCNHPHIMLQLRHVFLGGRLLGERPRQHELGLEDRPGGCHPAVKGGRHPL